MNIEWIHQAVSCFCPSWFFLWLVKPVLGGAQTFHPTFPKSDWQTGRRKWGHGGTRGSCSSFLKGTPGYDSRLVLLIMHAEGFHCPSCPTNCGMRICHRLLDAAWKEDPIFIYIHGGVSTQMTLLACRVALREETCFIAGAACGNCCLSAVHFPTWAPKKNNNKTKKEEKHPTIDSFSVSRKSQWNHLFFQSLIYSNIMEKAAMGGAEMVWWGQLSG